MRKATETLSRCWTWLRRFRHRCGYGIHSPFAFNLVTGVVYESGEFYAYAPLSEKRGAATGREKDDRLMLRLANDHQPRTCLTDIAPGEATAAYLEAGCRKCRFRGFKDEGWREALDGWKQVEMVYSDTPAHWPELLAAVRPYVCGRTLVVLKGIRRDAAAKAAWKELEGSPETRVAFDLGDIGLAYFDPKLNKQSYTINYI